MLDCGSHLAVCRASADTTKTSRRVESANGSWLRATEGDLHFWHCRLTSGPSQTARGSWCRWNQKLWRDQAGRTTRHPPDQRCVAQCASQCTTLQEGQSHGQSQSNRQGQARGLSIYLVLFRYMMHSKWRRRKTTKPLTSSYFQWSQWHSIWHSAAFYLAKVLILCLTTFLTVNLAILAYLLTSFLGGWGPDRSGAHWVPEVLRLREEEEAGENLTTLTWQVGRYKTTVTTTCKLRYRTLLFYVWRFPKQVEVGAVDISRLSSPNCLNITVRTQNPKTW